MVAVLWLAKLRDPADEVVLEAVIDGGVDVLVTVNRRHFDDAPGRFGIFVAAPTGIEEDVAENESGRSVSVRCAYLCP